MERRLSKDSFTAKLLRKLYGFDWFSSSPALVLLHMEVLKSCEFRCFGFTGSITFRLSGSY